MFDISCRGASYRDGSQMISLSSGGETIKSESCTNHCFHAGLRMDLYHPQCPGVRCKLREVPEVGSWFGEWRRRGACVADLEKGTIEWKVCLYHLFQKNWYVLKHPRELGVFLALGRALHAFKNKNCWRFFQLSLVWIKALWFPVFLSTDNTRLGSRDVLALHTGLAGVLGRKMKHLVFLQMSNLLFTGKSLVLPGGWFCVVQGFWSGNPVNHLQAEELEEGCSCWELCAKTVQCRLWVSFRVRTELQRV